MISFSPLSFREQLKEWQKKQKDETSKRPTLNTAFEMIADKVHVSSDAVKNWYNGHNGPNDLQTIKNMAEVIDTSYMDIVNRSEDMNNMIEPKTNTVTVGNGEKEAIEQMYKSFADYIYMFAGLSNCHALQVYDDPEEELHKSQWDMYYALDQMALSISEDTYKKLRKTILELFVITSATSDGGFDIPELWKELNPRLESKPFMRTLLWADDTCSVLYGNDDPELELTFEEVDDFFHTAIEDAPDCVTSLVPTSKMEKIPGTSDYKEIPIKPDEYSKAQLFFNLRTVEPPHLSEFIAREFASTLIKVMKHRFPQYF